MQTIILICLALPVLWLMFVKHSRSVVYSGTAELLPRSAYIGLSGRNAFASLIVPGIGEMLVDIPVKTAESLPAQANPLQVYVEIQRSLTGTLSVKSLKLDGKLQSVDIVDGGALGVAVIYLIGGFVAIGSLPLVSAVAFICSGYVMGNCLGPNLDRKLGTMFALGIMAIQLLLVTLVIFSMPTSLLTFLLGFPVSFAFGQVLGMLLRAPAEK
jgi:hypothetical protein